MVDFVRKECPTQRLHIDCEGGLGLQHMEMLYRLEDFALDDRATAGARRLGGPRHGAGIAATPLGLDEGIANLAQAEIAMECIAANTSA